MNRAKRDQAVRAFISLEKARVMLMSLKCGGSSFDRSLHATLIYGFTRRRIEPRMAVGGWIASV